MNKSPGLLLDWIGNGFLFFKLPSDHMSPTFLSTDEIARINSHLGESYRQAYYYPSM